MVSDFRQLLVYWRTQSTDFWDIDYMASPTYQTNVNTTEKRSLKKTYVKLEMFLLMFMFWASIENIE